MGGSKEEKIGSKLLKKLKMETFSSLLPKFYLCDGWEVWRNISPERHFQSKITLRYSKVNKNHGPKIRCQKPCLVLELTQILPLPFTLSRYQHLSGEFLALLLERECAPCMSGKSMGPCLPDHTPWIRAKHDWWQLGKPCVSDWKLLL